MRVFLVFMALIVTGCGSSLEKQQSIISNRYSLAYLHDSKAIADKRNINVYIDSLKIEKNIADSLVVHSKSAFVLPLVFIDVWNFNYDCIFGRNVLVENNKDFIKSNLITEVKRSGIFNIVSTPDSADYSLNIKITDSKCSGGYNQNGFFYFLLFAFGYRVAEKAGPEVSTVNWSYDLRKGNLSVLRDSIVTVKVAAPPRLFMRDYAQLRKDFGSGMAVALSDAYKECIESTVSTINTSIK
jgi:hypothetical protein